MTDQQLADDIKAQYQITFDAIAQGGGTAEMDALISKLTIAYAKAAKGPRDWSLKACAYLAAARGHANLARTYPGNDYRKKGMIDLSLSNANLAADVIPNTTIQSGAC